MRRIEVEEWAGDNGNERKNRIEGKRREMREDTR